MKSWKAVTSLTISKYSAVVLILGLTSYCRNADDAAFSGGFKQMKSTGSGGTDAKLVPKQAVKGLFRIRVSLHPESTAEENIGLCNGKLNLIIMDNFKLQFPDSKIKCVGGLGGSQATGEIDIAAILGQFAGDDMLEELFPENKMLRTKKVGKMSFEPARPFILGPIIQDVSSYSGFSESNSYVGTIVSSTTGQTITDQGTIAVKVASVDQQFTPVLMPTKSFDHVVHWSMETSGFGKLPRTQGMLFESMEYWFNTRPIGIPRILIKSKASDFLDATPADSTAAPLLNGPLAPVIKSIAGLLTLYVQIDAISFENF